LFLNSYVAQKFDEYKWPYIYRVNDTDVSVGKLRFSSLGDEVKKCHVSRYSAFPGGHAVNNMKVYGHITNPIRSFASYMNQYFFEYMVLDLDYLSEKIKFIRYWNGILPSIVENLNKRLISNKSYVSVMDELNSKKIR